MFTQLVKPFEDGRISSKRPKFYLIKWLFKAENVKGSFLCQNLLLSLIRFSKLAKKVIETGDERGNAARFLILGPSDTVPSVHVHVLSLEAIFCTSEKGFFLYFCNNSSL